MESNDHKKSELSSKKRNYFHIHNLVKQFPFLWEAILFRILLCGLPIEEKEKMIQLWLERQALLDDMSSFALNQKGIRFVTDFERYVGGSIPTNIKETLKTIHTSTLRRDLRSLLKTIPGNELENRKEAFLLELTKWMNGIEDETIASHVASSLQDISKKTGDTGSKICENFTLYCGMMIEMYFIEFGMNKSLNLDQRYERTQSWIYTWGREIFNKDLYTNTDIRKFTSALKIAAPYLYHKLFLFTSKTCKILGIVLPVMGIFKGSDTLLEWFGIGITSTCLLLTSWLAKRATKGFYEDKYQRGLKMLKHFECIELLTESVLKKMLKDLFANSTTSSNQNSLGSANFPELYQLLSSYASTPSAASSLLEAPVNDKKKEKIKTKRKPTSETTPEKHGVMIEKQADEKNIIKDGATEYIFLHKNNKFAKISPEKLGSLFFNVKTQLRDTGKIDMLESTERKRKGYPRDSSHKLRLKVGDRIIFRSRKLIVEERNILSHYLNKINKELDKEEVYSPIAIESGHKKVYRI